MRKLFLYVSLLLVACGTESNKLSLVVTNDPSTLRKSMRQCMEMKNTFFHIKEESVGARIEPKMKYIGTCYRHKTPWETLEANND